MTDKYEIRELEQMNKKLDDLESAVRRLRENVLDAIRLKHEIEESSDEEEIELMEDDLEDLEDKIEHQQSKI